jgi:hypothetical protein
MKTKKYAVGGISNMSPGMSPLEPLTGGGTGMGSSGGSATDGLGQVNSGASTIGNAISSASKALTGGGIGGISVRPPGPIQPGVTPLPAPAYPGGPRGANPFSTDPFKKGGSVKAKPKTKTYASGGSVKSSASKRGDGCAVRGKTKGMMR